MIDLLYLAGVIIGAAYFTMWVNLTHIWYEYFKNKSN